MGRPKIKKGRPIILNLSDDIIEKLDNKTSNRSKFIDDLLRKELIDEKEDDELDVST